MIQKLVLFIMDNKFYDLIYLLNYHDLYNHINKDDFSLIPPTSDLLK